MDLNSFLELGGFKILVFWGDGAGVANGQVNVTFRGRVYNWSAFFLKKKKQNKDFFKSDLTLTDLNLAVYLFINVLTPSPLLTPPL